MTAKPHVVVCKLKLKQPLHCWLNNANCKIVLLTGSYFQKYYSCGTPVTAACTSVIIRFRISSPNSEELHVNLMFVYNKSYLIILSSFIISSAEHASQVYPINFQSCLAYLVILPITQSCWKSNGFIMDQTSFYFSISHINIYKMYQIVT
jgi:hypothetical protein